MVHDYKLSKDERFSKKMFDFKESIIPNRTVSSVVQENQSLLNELQNLKKENTRLENLLLSMGLNQEKIAHGKRKLKRTNS